MPKQVRMQVDELVLRNDRLRAVRVTMEAVQDLWDGSQGPRPGLYDCRRVVMARYQALGDGIIATAIPPRDVETLTTRIHQSPGCPAAVEALWDGDTDGWFVVLVAVFDDPRCEVDLAWIRHGSDLRVFDGQVPPWPEAREAVEIGTALADRFKVPFHFASPDEPDDEAPRWRTGP
ncbi:hypothetical protein [Streptomyces sp. NBC_00035]|uniref:hypothetical protein n=1 Tax=Streptomyces sp. NBC_00035 TaxID=2903614 RepID=UPI003252D1D9